MATAVHSPSAYRHHIFTPSTSSSHSSSATTPRTLHKHSSSYRTISSSAGVNATMASYSSQSSAGRPGSSHDGGYHSQHLHGKLHKRSTSKETSSTTATGNGGGGSTASITPTHEEFFPSDAMHHKKGLIKPLSLLKKVSSSSGSGKLDLGKADGGAGGVYYSSSSPYIGKQASATDLTSFVPTHRQQHKRTISGNSAGSNNSAPNYYPPRRYAPTPSQSYPNSIGGDSSDEDTDTDYYLEGNTAATGGSSSAAPFPHTRKRAATQPLRVVTSSTGLPLVLPPRIPTSESAPISPITPLGRSATLDSFDRKRNDSFDRKRKDSIDRKRKIVGGRNSSEEYVESMKRAREKFEEQERRKDEKEERKARKSISKDDHRRRSISKEESRRPSNDGSTTIASTSKTRWFTSARHSTPELGTTAEKTIGIPYGGGPGSVSNSSTPGIGGKAVTSLRNVPMRAADDAGRRSRSEKRGGVTTPRGFRNQWQGFVMWVQIGFVRMGRKVRSFFDRKT
ncbi:hypothetical protein ABW21_db0205690 [Orbilia brochopaga]|nr:hypothetical protein ABW21_db0205690 [Drechslerella brochopaga]